MNGDVSLHASQADDPDYTTFLQRLYVDKYLGVVEGTTIKHAAMKEKTMNTFEKRLKSLLNAELNAKNIFVAIGEYANPVISYTFGILNWTEEEIKNIDIHVRKRLSLYRMFYNVTQE